MLPSKGYFKSLNCPYHQNSYCNRPHCHFRHVRRDDIFDSSSFNGSNTVCAPPAVNAYYKPTPIAELKKRHLPVNSIPSAAVFPMKRRIEPYNVKYGRRPKEEYKPEAYNKKANTAVYKATKIADRSNPDETSRDNMESPDLEEEEKEDEESDVEIDLEMVKKELNYIGEILKKIENKEAGLNDMSGETSTSVEQSSEEMSKASASSEMCNEEQKLTESISNDSLDDKSKKEKKEESSKTSTKDHESNHKISSSNHKRKVEDLQKTTKCKDKTKESNVITDLFDGNQEIKKEEDKSKKQNHHHGSSSRKSGKENKHSHSSSSSSKLARKDSEHSKNDTEHSKKSSEHHKKESEHCKKNLEHRHSSSSSTKKSNEKSTTSKSASKDLAHKSNSKCSKKDSDTMSISEKSKSKHKSSRSDHSSSKQGTKERSRDKERHKSSSSRKPRTERKSAHDSDDDVEIISSSESIIVIDSDDEKDKIVKNKRKSTCEEKYKEKRTKRDVSEEKEHNRGRHSVSPSLSRSPSPCLPSDVSSSEEEPEQTVTSSRLSDPAQATTSGVELDMRVISKKKNRVSLGNAARPPQNNLKKPVKLLTPAERLMQFRRMENSENSENNTKPKICGVPNVQSLLLEKQRLTSGGSGVKPKSTFEEKKLLYMQRKNIPIPQQPQNMDAPPKPLPSKGLGDKSSRDSGIAKLWRRFRNLVPPGDSIQPHLNRCQQAELNIFESSKGVGDVDYFKKIKEFIAKMEQTQIPAFTQRHFRSIVPPRFKLFPVELNPDNDEKVSLYSEASKCKLNEGQLIKEGFPRKCPDFEETGLCYVDTDSIRRWDSRRRLPVYVPRKTADDRLLYTCKNCDQEFEVDEETQLSLTPCRYHWNKYPVKPKEKSDPGLKPKYNCCAQSDPCQSSLHHCYESKDHMRLAGFMETPKPQGEMPSEGWGMYALDCEMYFSTQGQELGRVSVVDVNLRCVYDAYVKNERNVADYHYGKSGLTQELLDSGRSFDSVRADLLELFNAETILIGHSLDGDLKALKILHSSVVDTSMIYPPEPGSKGKKKRLQQIVQTVLGMADFQSGESGHSSIDDSEACMSLVLMHVVKASKTKSAAPRMNKPPSCKSKNIYDTS